MEGLTTATSGKKLKASKAQNSKTNLPTQTKEAEGEITLEQFRNMHKGKFEKKQLLMSDSAPQRLKKELEKQQQKENVVTRDQKRAIDIVTNALTDSDEEVDEERNASLAALTAALKSSPIHQGAVIASASASAATVTASPAATALSLSNG